MKIPSYPGPNLNTHKPKLACPAHAADCHFHIIGPEDKYPFVSDRAYNPSLATVKQYKAMRDVLGLERGVIVQPSFYGTDNSCTLDALKELGSNYRAVVVPPKDLDTKVLYSWKEQGVVGIRMNTIFKGSFSGLDAVKEIAQMIRQVGFHIQIYTKGTIWEALAPELEKLDTTIVIDHVGNMPTSYGLDHPSFQALLRLLHNPNVWIKLCGDFRFSCQHAPYDDTLPYIHKVVEAAPSRCLWATDWPHTRLDDMFNDGDLFDKLEKWVPNETIRHQILVKNPEQLYKFK